MTIENRGVEIRGVENRGVEIREVPRDEVETVIPLLTLAEPWEAGLRWGLAHLSDAVYRMDAYDTDAYEPNAEGELVGAASVAWAHEPPEIQEIAIAEARQGQGLGKQLIAWLLDEARRRGRQSLLVGTPNASIGNIAFYQRAGFRMDHIRHDYFRYYRKPRYENGIRVRDLLVFRHDLTDAEENAKENAEEQ